MKRTILIIVLALVALLLIYKLVTYTEPSFNQVEIKTNNNIVYNSTENKYMDSVVYVGLNEMQIDGVMVVIRPMLTAKSTEDLTLKAHIVATDFNYIIFTGSYPRAETISILCHELIHLQQYHSGKLVIKNKQITWKGETSDLDTWMSVSYQNRPWEQEAFREQQELTTKVRNILYQ